MDADLLKTKLSRLRLFRELPDGMRDRTMRVLIDVSKARSVPDGVQLFERGDESGDRGYVLLEGTILVEKPDRPVLEVEGPELLGELKQITPDHRRTATVIADKGVRVLKFNWTEFFNAARQVLSESEMQTLSQGIEKIAWSHVAE